MMGTRIETKIGPFLAIESREEVHKRIEEALGMDAQFITLTQRPTHSNSEAFQVDIRVADIVTMRDTANGGQ